MIVSRKTSARSIKNRNGKDVQNKKGESTIYLYGDIGGWFGVDHLDWVKEFNALDTGIIHVRIDSAGGDIFAARSMQTAIKQSKATVIAHIDGVAASAASFLAMGADEIEIVDGGFLMVHNAASFLDVLGYFNIGEIAELIADLEKEKNLHGQLNTSIANDYAKKSGKPLDEVVGWMDSETWFSAQDALDNGLVDRVFDGKPVEANYDLSIYNNAPEAIKARNQQASKRTIEKALRDAGLSKNVAKAILAEGYKEGTSYKEGTTGKDQRDADAPQQPSSITDSSSTSTAAGPTDANIPTPQADTPVNQRDADEPDNSQEPENKPAEQKPARDRIRELLIKAEVIAPSRD